MKTTRRGKYSPWFSRGPEGHGVANQVEDRVVAVAHRHSTYNARVSLSVIPLIRPADELSVVLGVLFAHLIKA